MLRAVLQALEKQYGPPVHPRARDPFEWIIYENVAYLVDDRTRAATLSSLKSAVGKIAPRELLLAGEERIGAAIEGGGMLPGVRAKKVVEAARTAQDLCDGALRERLDELDARKRRALLRKFPGIGAPGADKILLFCGYEAAPAVDSNGLRVLARLGLIEEERAYERSYFAAVGIIHEAFGEDTETLIDAYVLLQTHGRELCKRGAPQCEPCGLRASCRFALSHAAAKTE